MFLFQTTPTDAFPTGGEANAYDYTTKVAGAVQTAFTLKKVQGFFLDVEKQALQLNRNISNGLVSLQKTVGETLTNVYEQTIDYGGTIQDASDYLSSYSETLGKIPNIQETVVKQAVLFSKASGVATKEIAVAVGQYAQFGMSQKESLNQVQKTFLTARRYGVDSQKLSKTVQENLNKANAYGFKDGLNSLTQMAAKSQSLNTSMKSAFEVADDVMSPDKALEFATNMEMLGGTGPLSDFQQVLYMARNDMEGFKSMMDEEIKNISTFNAQTGNINKPSDAARERAREMAKLLHKSTEEIMQESAALNKQAFAMDQIKDSLTKQNFTEEDIAFIASLSEVQNGKVEIKIPGISGVDEMVEASKVTKAQLDLLRRPGDEVTEEKNVNQRIGQIAEKQLSTLETMNNSIKKIELSEVFKIGYGKATETGGMIESLNKLAAAGNDIAKTLETMNTSGFLTAANAFTTEVARDLTDWTNTQLGPLITKYINVVVSAATPTLPTPDGFFPAGGKPVIMREGTFYEGLSNDEIMMGTNLTDGFNILAEKDEKIQNLLTKSNNSSSKNLELINKYQTNNLSQIVTTNTTNINNTNTQKVEGGFTVTIDASKVPNNLDPTMLKNEIMNVMSKLGDEMKKQGVLNFRI